MTPAAELRKRVAEIRLRLRTEAESKPEAEITDEDAFTLLELFDRLEAVAAHASEINRLLHEWELIRQHSYAHEKLDELLQHAGWES